MSADNFDQELTALYQQRKQQIEAPEINVERLNATAKRPLSITKMLLLLLTAGSASFAIMAIVTHLATPSKSTNDQQFKHYTVAIVDAEKLKKTDTETIVVPTTPASPPLKPTKSSLPAIPNANLLEKASVVAIEPELFLTKAVDTTIAVPVIESPKVSVKPIHKVMPKYPKNALYNSETAKIKLQYRINENGSVTDIEVVNKQQNRVLAKAAKKALSQWRYPAKTHITKPLAIEFEFKID